LLGAIFTVILLIVVAAIGYNIGWSQGVGTHLPAGAANAPAYYYGYGFHPFFAGFGILWFLLILFGIFWLFRLAFWGRRWGGWYGPRGMYGGHHGPGGSFEERAQEWHRRQHGEQSPSGTPPPPPPADTRSV
jgi:hypothetical protein